MTKSITGISVMCLLTLLVTSSFVVVSEAPQQLSFSTNVERSSLSRYVLIADAGNSHVIMVNNAGDIVREIPWLNNPTDAKLLSNGDVLISEMDAGRVVEFNYAGGVVWQYTGLVNPVDSERLPNGNTLITVNPESGPDRVFEVDSSGTLVWEKTGLSGPVDAQRLSNGNTLIAEVGNNRVIEVDGSGTIVWQKTGLQFPASAERLANGNTLIAELQAYRVIEVDPAGSIVWQKTGYEMPCDAHRLSNGDTLISDFEHGVYEVNPAGTTVWQMTNLNGPYSAYAYFSNPPNQPTINGPASGKINEPLSYSFVSTDPDNDPLFYFVDWGDSANTGWVGPYASNEHVNLSHTWTEKGTYVLKAKVADIYSADSDWATLSVTLPQTSNAFEPHSFLSWLLARFPHAFPILQHILGS